MNPKEGSDYKKKRSIKSKKVVKRVFDSAFLLCMICISAFIIYNVLHVNIFSEKYRGIFVGLAASSKGVFILILPVLSVFSFFYSVTYLKIKYGFFSKNKIDKAEVFLQQVFRSEDEYCLVLRPFGNDASFKLQNINSEYYFDSMISNWADGIVIEQILEKKNKESRNIDTVALVDPRLKLIPHSPRFISTSNDTWQWVIFDLLKRALYTFIIIPPRKKITDALVWEVTKLVQLGLIGRFAIIIPPQSFLENKTTVKDIKEKLYFLSDNLNSIDDATYLIYPNNVTGVNSYYNGWHRMSDKEKKKHLEVLPLQGYVDAINKTVTQMNTLADELTFQERYPYIDSSYSDLDVEFTTEYINLFLKNGRNPTV